MVIRSDRGFLKPDDPLFSEGWSFTSIVVRGTPKDQPPQPQKPDPSAPQPPEPEPEKPPEK